LDTAWLANDLAKQSRQTRLAEIIHNTTNLTTKPNETKLALVQDAHGPLTAELITRTALYTNLVTIQQS